MKPALFLRLAAAVSLLLCVGHMLGRPWTPSHDAQAAAVIEAMRSYRAHVMGFERSYMDFYVGFGLMLGVYLLAQAVLLWQLAAFAGAAPARTRPMIAVFAVANLAITVLDWEFLFTVPVIMSAIVTLCLGLALVAARAGAIQADAGIRRA